MELYCIQMNSSNSIRFSQSLLLFFWYFCIKFFLQSLFYKLSSFSRKGKFSTFPGRSFDIYVYFTNKRIVYFDKFFYHVTQSRKPIESVCQRKLPDSSFQCNHFILMLISIYVYIAVSNCLLGPIQY